MSPRTYHNHQSQRMNYYFSRLAQIKTSRLHLKDLGKKYLQNFCQFVYKDFFLFLDLRFKKEPVQQDESPSSTAGNHLLNSTTSSNGSIHSQTNYNKDGGGTILRDKEIFQANLWHPGTGKLAKTGTINTPDGKYTSSL